VVLGKMYSAGITPNTTYRFAEKDDIESLARVNTVNPAYQEHLDYRFGIDRKNEFFLVAERAPQPTKKRKGRAKSKPKAAAAAEQKKTIVGMCNYYFHWYKPSRALLSGSSSSPTEPGRRSRKSSFDHDDGSKGGKRSRRTSPDTSKRSSPREGSPLTLTHDRHKARKIMYVATLQATKQDSSGDSAAVCSENRTGVALLCLVRQQRSSARWVFAHFD